MKSVHQNMIGQVVGSGYTLTKVLGVGGFAAVYKGENSDTGKIAAVKLLSTLEDEYSVKRFKREVKLASTLRHPNICRITEYWVDRKGVPGFAMDYIEGQPLDYIIENEGRLEQSRTVSRFFEICSAVEFAHKRSIVHRDIKPGNMMIRNSIDSSPESAIVVDFGLSKNFINPTESSQITKTGDLCGTPTFMSPEQCRGEKIDNRVDVYLLGCLLYTMLSGKRPFLADNAIATMKLHLFGEPDYLEFGLGEDFVPVIKKAMSKEPRDRFDSVDDMVLAIKSFYKD